MARRIGFHTYSFRVRGKYKENYENLSSISGKQDLLSLLHSSMSKDLGNQNDNEEFERLSCIKKVDRNGRHLTGLIEAGHYGETANIVHAKSGRTMHFQKTDEASLLPCFFRLVLPANRDQGLLILQRDNRIQGKQAFRDFVESAVKKFGPNLNCEIEPILNRETFMKMIGEGEIQQLKFIRLSIPQDFADAYDKGMKETKGTMEVTIKARRRGSLPMKKRVNEWLNSKERINDLFTIPGLEDFAYDTVKADIRIGDTRRTVDFGKRLSNPIIDLTGQLKRDKNGHPTYASLLEETQRLASDKMFEAFGE